MFGTREEFEYVECDDCGSIQIASVPGDLGRHYPSGYYSMRPREAPPPRSSIKNWLIGLYAEANVRDANGWQANLLSAFLPEPNEWHEFKRYLLGSGLSSLDDPILDVGCGSSPHRLAAIKRLGFRTVLGIDPFVLRDLVYEDVPVRKQSIDECEGKFKWIMFHHSLEHVADPVQTLAAAAERLLDDGRCLVRVPVLSGWMWGHFGLDWVEFDAPRHLHMFSSQGLAAAAARAGLTVVSCVHESEGWEIAWSEAYRLGVPMHGQGSKRIEEMFSPSRMEEFETRALELNRLHIGGRAAFVLRKQ